jgi:diaminopimelate decarboxylase
MPRLARWRYDFFGPICRTFADREKPNSDRCGDERPHPPDPLRGVSRHRDRLSVPEVLVKGERFAVVHPRPSYDELIGLDRLPDWLG